MKKFGGSAFVNKTMDSLIRVYGMPKVNEMKSQLMYNTENTVIKFRN